MLFVGMVNLTPAVYAKGKFTEVGSTIYYHHFSYIGYHVHLTKLKDGRILIVGDSYKNYNYEIFNPKDNSFESITPKVLRKIAPPVVLDDGRVLLVDYKGRETEIYDPKKDTFKRIGGLVVPRKSFGMVKMSDGRVLITNGWKTCGSRVPALTAEIFDPKTEKYSLTGETAVNVKDYCQTQIRAGNGSACSTLLDNGNVLVFWENRAAAEIYNPKTGKFRRIDNWLPEVKPNYSPDVTAYNLRDGKIFILDKEARYQEQYTWLFDSKTETYHKTKPLAVRKRGYSFMNASNWGDDKILIYGGVYYLRIMPMSLAVRAMQLYDLKTNSYKHIDNIPSEFDLGPSIALDDGRMFFLNTKHLHDSMTDKYMALTTVVIYENDKINRR